ncbi:DUF6323 family protein [Dethiothermospora halolimnae]|uniref:DUF6323 family protein n=1 Tax=Dethiothermospora halolimnae TaxID=3114390 RepID=UPI003CCBAB74
MSLPIIFNSKAIKESYVTELLKSNKKIKKYGLTLTSKEVSKIVEVRNDILENYDRVELGIQVTKKLIEDFSSSSYVDENDYIFVLNELQEIFYYLKNETEDRIGDIQLIDIIRKCFENECGGSVELLKSKLQEFVKEFRRKIEIEENINEGGVY